MRCTACSRAKGPRDQEPHTTELKRQSSCHREGAGYLDILQLVNRGRKPRPGNYGRPCEGKFFLGQAVNTRVSERICVLAISGHDRPVGIGAVISEDENLRHKRKAMSPAAISARPPTTYFKPEVKKM